MESELDNFPTLNTTIPILILVLLVACAIVYFKLQKATIVLS